MCVSFSHCQPNRARHKHELLQQTLHPNKHAGCCAAVGCSNAAMTSCTSGLVTADVPRKPSVIGRSVGGTHLSCMRPLAMPWPAKPHTSPARLYSRNLMPRHAERSSTVYRGAPAGLGANTALGMRARILCMPARNSCRQLHAVGIRR
jgi:hypothetical protein